MSIVQRYFSLLVAGAALLLVACSGNLPEGLQIERQPLADLVENKVGEIVYVGADANIYVTNQVGRDPTVITTDAHDGPFRYVYHSPAWSRDSSTIAFAADTGRQDQPTLGTVIYTVSSEGGVLNEAFSGSNTSPLQLNWSPDGNYLSFLATNSTGQPFQSGAIRLDGTTNPLLFSPTSSPLYIAWSPDSQTLLTHLEPSGGNRGLLGTLALDARSDIQRLPYNTAQFQAPAWSPDGSHLLFAVEDDGQDALVIADADGSRPRVMDQYVGRASFGWSPDSRFTAYITSANVPIESAFTSAVGSLKSFDVRRGKTETVTDDPVVAFFWSPDSEKLAYFVPSMITDEASGNQQLSVELRVANRDGGNTRTLNTFRPPGPFLRILTIFDQFLDSATIWSPDSQFVVYSIAGTATVPPLIQVMHVSGSLAPRTVGAGSVAFWSWE